VPAGRVVALVGRTGCGKSTLLSLLSRTFDPPPGTVLLDGVDVRRYALGWLRAQIATVPQESFLFSATVAENIAYGVAHADAEGIERAARVAGLDTEVRGFPRGYDVYLCTLFLHHLRESEAVELLRRMAGGRALLVSDLVRSRPGYWAARVGTRFLTRSPVVHADAAASVEGAFTRAELHALADAAGLDGARIRPHWPFRMLLEWCRG